MDAHHARPWQLGARGRWLFDLTLAGALFVVGGLGHLAAGQLASAVFTCVQALPLVWRRHHPVPVFAVIASASAVQAVLIDTPVVGQFAFPIAVYSVARWAPRWQAWSRWRSAWPVQWSHPCAGTSPSARTRPSGAVVPYGITVQVLIGSVLDDAAMSVPVLQLGGVVLVAAVAGLGACVLPARRAARITPAAGLALD